MRWEFSVLALIDDLEQQAAGLHLRERDIEVRDRSIGEYAEITHESRWHASLGGSVRVVLLGEVSVRGELARTGAGWAVVVTPEGRAWLLPLAAVARVDGLSNRSTAQQALTQTRRLGLGSVLRSLARGHEPVVVHLCDGARLDGHLGRVGADFVEVRTPSGLGVVPLAAVGAVVSR